MASSNTARKVTELHDPQSIVKQFFAACSALDVDRALGFIDENCVYKNIPFHTAKGKARIERDIGGLLKRMSVFDVEMVNIAANGNVVLTERVDTLGVRFFTAAIPLMGTFVIENGKITEWRDYFDWSYAVGKVGQGVLTKLFKSQ